MIIIGGARLVPLNAEVTLLPNKYYSSLRMVTSEDDLCQLIFQTCRSRLVSLLVLANTNRRQRLLRTDRQREREPSIALRPN